MNIHTVLSVLISIFFSGLFLGQDGVHEVLPQNMPPAKAGFASGPVGAP